MYKNILFTLDLNAQGDQEKALASAVAMAELYKAKLHILSVFPDFGLSMVGTYFPKDFEKKALAKAEEELHTYVKKKVPATVDASYFVAHGTIYKEILAYAEKHKINLIVMASHRPELKDYLLGPNAARVVRHADCSVLVVRQ